MGINLGSLCREPPKLTLLTSGNPGDEGAPALAGGGEMVRKVTFDLKLYLRLAGSPPPLTRTPKTRVARFGEPRTQGRLCCGSHKLVGDVDPYTGKSVAILRYIWLLTQQQIIDFACKIVMKDAKILRYARG